MKKFIQLSILVFAIATTFNCVANPKFQPTTKPITIVIPYPAGGAGDRMARIVSEMFTDHGWNSVVLNKPGADGVIGTNLAAQAAPDGHTLYLGNTGALDANLVYNAPGVEYTMDSFVPVAPLGVSGFILTVNNKSTVRSYKEFKAYVKQNPNKFTVGFWNTNMSNIFLEWARLEGLPKPNIVIYKGSAPMSLDLLGGHIEFAFDSIPSAMENYRAGRYRIIAAMDQTGTDIIKSITPDADVVNLSARHTDLGIMLYWGVYAPRGTDPVVAEQIRQVVNAAFRQRDSKYRNMLIVMGIRQLGTRPEELAQAQNKTYTAFRKSQANAK
jgi:tripartite-type tricarboxylate transporter receptor subunit TctC